MLTPKTLVFPPIVHGYSSLQLYDYLVASDILSLYPIEVRERFRLVGITGYRLLTSCHDPSFLEGCNLFPAFAADMADKVAAVYVAAGTVFSLELLFE
jgi:hypothetical protein